MKLKNMISMKYCFLCFIVLTFFNPVKAQEYFSLTGSSKYAFLEQTFIWTCRILKPEQLPTNYVLFKRNTFTTCVGIGYINEACRIDSYNISKYTYECVSKNVYTLTIPAENMTEDEQNSQWHCESIVNSTYRSSSIFLEIAIPVYNISISPNDNPLTISESAQIEFECVVNTNAVPAPTILWYLGSINIASTALTYASSINITGNKTDNTKRLECRATNSNSSKTASTTLNVEYPPIVNKLSHQNIIEGRNLSVTCQAKSGNPNSTTLYWTKVDNQGFKQDGATLQLPNINRTSTGTYKCTAENSYSSREKGAHSQSMVINVEYPPLVFKLSQQDIKEGSDLSVPCQGTDGNPSSTTFFWTKVDNPGFRQNGSILQLPYIQRNHSGTYRCTAENIYSNREKGAHSQTMGVNVLYPPYVYTLSQQTIREGSDLNVTCRANPGNPNSTTFHWTKVDNAGFRQEGPTLLIPKINRTSSDTYRCTAENSYSNEEMGTDNQSMFVDVQYQPTIKIKPLHIINESETVNLTGDISSNPLSNVSWYDKTGLLKAQTSVTTALFNIVNATCTDTKNLTLVVQNIIGNNRVVVELIVNCKPKPDKNNITLGITDVTGIEFSTIVIAYPEPDYILENENRTKNTRLMESITMNAINNFTIHFNQTIVEQSDYGSYYLKLSNLFGTTTVFINVLAQRRPDVPRDIKVECEESGAKVQWVSSFNGGDDQTFITFVYKDQKTSYSSRIPDAGENKVHSNYVENLQPSVSYVFYVSAQNRHGNSSSENITCTTLKKDTGDSLPLIVGGAAAAGIALATIVIAVVLLRRYMQIDKQAGKAQRLKQDGENEDTSDDGIKDNILYVSAGPKVDENPKAAVYASVNKTGPESNNNSNVYAEVNKSGRIIAEEGALYSDVKPKRGLFKKDVNRKKDGNPKQKKGKKQKSKQDVADVYENSEDIAMSSKSDNVYSNTGQKVQNKEERGYKNKDGLLYVEVQFDAKTEKGNQTIHGEDEKTDYATVEFPMAASKHDESGNQKI